MADATSWVTTLCDQPDNIRACVNGNSCNNAFCDLSGPQCYRCSFATCPHWQSYNAEQLVQMGYKDPMEFGCTTWGACSWEVVPNSDQQVSAQSVGLGDDCNWWPMVQHVSVRKTGFDPAISTICCSSTLSTLTGVVIAGNGNTLTRALACRPDWVPDSPYCLNLLYPPAPCGDDDEYDPQAPEANREKCCTGFFGEGSLSACRPGWCPNDPYGSCSDILSARCWGLDPACNKAMLLADTACNQWYTNATTFLGHPARPSVLASTTEWCETEPGFSSGECACMTAHDRMMNIQAGGRTPVFGFDGQHPTQPTIRRVDLYCVSGDGTSKIDPSNPYSSPCAGGLGATSTNAPTITPLPGMLEWLPQHCWLGDCQPNSAYCRFATPQDDILKCPNICAQISGGNRINIGGDGGVHASDVVIIDGLFSQCSFPDGAVPLTSAFAMLDASSPGSQPVLQLEYCMTPGTRVDVPLVLANNANDPKWASMSDVLYNVQTSFGSLASITSGNASGTLTSGGAVPLVLTIDTTPMTDYIAQYNGAIGIFDPTGANDPLEIVTTINVLPADAIPAGAAPGSCSASSSVRLLTASNLNGSNSAVSNSAASNWALGLGVTGALLVLALLGFLAYSKFGRGRSK